jgi:hypothetical protein
MINQKYILLTSILCVGSFIVGARLGTEAFVYSDAKYKAAMAVAKLKRLDKGDLSALKDDLEFDLDRNIYWHSKGQNNFLRFLWPDLIDKENKVISISAKYRINNPESYFKTETGEFDDMAKTVKEIADQYGQ